MFKQVQTRCTDYIDAGLLWMALDHPTSAIETISNKHEAKFTRKIIFLSPHAEFSSEASVEPTKTKKNRQEPSKLGKIGKTFPFVSFFRPRFSFRPFPPLHRSFPQKPTLINGPMTNDFLPWHDLMNWNQWPLNEKAYFSIYRPRLLLISRLVKTRHLQEDGFCSASGRDDRELLIIHSCTSYSNIGRGLL